jgi:non-ribosomal peptide synthetase component F
MHDFGVLRLGATYVSLDPEYPIDRLRYIAGHCGSAVVLRDLSSAAVAAELGPPRSRWRTPPGTSAGRRAPAPAPGRRLRAADRVV